MLMVFYLFPDGRFVPRWTPALAAILGAWALIWITVPALDPFKWQGLARVLVMMGWYGTGGFAQVYRYVRVSRPVERQQTKWFVYGLTVGMLVMFVVIIADTIIPALSRPGLPGFLYGLLSTPVAYFFWTIVPLSLAIAVFRYRLDDIDVLINRTLVYGGLTGALALVYFAGVVLLQGAFRALTSQALTGQESQLAIVASTLAIAGLIQPLRRRLQATIDRRFYRVKVDFRQTFLEFSREVRTLIDLPELLRVLVERTTGLLAHPTRRGLLVERRRWHIPTGPGPQPAAGRGQEPGAGGQDVEPAQGWRCHLGGKGQNLPPAGALDRAAGRRARPGGNTGPGAAAGRPGL